MNRNILLMIVLHKRCPMYVRVWALRQLDSIDYGFEFDEYGPDSVLEFCTIGL